MTQSISADRRWKKSVRERDNYSCQYAGCGVHDQYIHAHHIQTRKQRPDRIHDVDNGVALCRPHHEWVHAHPIEAEALGLLGGESYELARQRQSWS